MIGFHVHGTVVLCHYHNLNRVYITSCRTDNEDFHRCLRSHNSATKISFKQVIKTVPACANVWQNIFTSAMYSKHFRLSNIVCNRGRKSTNYRPAKHIKSITTNLYIFIHFYTLRVYLYQTSMLFLAKYFKILLAQKCKNALNINIRLLCFTTCTFESSKTSTDIVLQTATHNNSQL